MLWRVGTGAVCPEPSQPAASSPSTAAGGRGAPYVPTTAPGARLPHAPLGGCALSLQQATDDTWSQMQCSDACAAYILCRTCLATPAVVRRLCVTLSGDSISTLDLVDRCCGGRPLLLLLLGKSPDAQPWLAAAKALESLPLRVCQIVPATSGQQGLGGTVSRTGPVLVNDASGLWQRLREVTEAGAILVRPDGHVAWRSHSGGDVEHCTEQLRTAVRQTMSL